MTSTTIHRVHVPLGGPARSLAQASVGRLGESLAAEHLRADGCRLLARNWRLWTDDLRGELDVVAMDPAHGELVVCEVRARRDAARFGGALEALDRRKRARVRALAAAFARESAARHRRVRCDFVAVDIAKTARLTHVIDAW